MTHTLGPWEWRRPDADRSAWGLYGENATVIEPSFDFAPANVDDARLIAAAPELLAALEAITEQIRNGPWDPPGLGRMHKVGFDAIAKATGTEVTT